MKIFGNFKDIDNNNIYVTIITDNDVSTEIEISRENNLWFSANPIQIETNIDDSFEHIIRKSATINLITKDYIGGDLFANNARSVEVTIEKENECIFFGYLEPNTFNQGFALPMEEFSLNCIDALSTLQYYKYNDTKPDNFEETKKHADILMFQTMMDNMFSSEVAKGYFYYDCSKGIASNRLPQVFLDCSISDNFIIGEDYEDTWTNIEVLEEILRYLNLHIIQHGYNFFIFDWDNIRNGNSTYLNLNTNAYETFDHEIVNFKSDMHSDTDTNITISDVYNQIAVKASTEKIETVIESPLEDKNLTSLYPSKQLFMTEFISEGSGDWAHDAMIDMLNNRPTTYKDAGEIDWFLQAMTNKNWKFYHNGRDMDELAEIEDNQYINQWKIPKYLRDHQCAPQIFKMGSVERKTSANDNSPISKISMKNYLYISVNGSEFDSLETVSPTEETLRDAQPIIEYIGNNSGGVFSPVDDETINYLVFSGQMLLQPIAYESTRSVAMRRNGYQDILDNGMRKSEGATAKVPNYYTIPSIIITTNNLVKSDTRDFKDRYYVRKFYKGKYSNQKPTEYLNDGSCSLHPWTKDKSAHGYQYKYSSKGDGTDKFSKLPILECELIIGNKRLIETNMDEFGNSTFEWVKIGEEPTERYIDTDGQEKTYTLTTFSLGVNPKIDDYIIGDEFSLQNTIDYTMNIDAEGTAIPIKKSDAVSGAVKFKILGLINLTWNEITRRHPSFWRHTKWYENTRFILSHTENVIIKDFECKVYSDNGGNTVTDDNDLIYMSDETDLFVNNKDNIEFKFITQLSSKECFEKGISPTINMNAVINSIDNLPLTSIYNAVTNETAKAEEHYVNSYYKEYSSPKIEMEMTLHNSDKLSMNNLYHSGILNKDFYLMKENYDVRFNTKTIKFKEI